MKIAVEGCAHGELDKIYESVATLEKENNFKVDLLICCGDFQAVRNASDLRCMAVPDKFLKINSFYKYYSGEKVAPVLTIFIGGNHEASNYLAELGYGGWAAPNIYYLGYAGIVRFGGVRIVGLSGIYKGYDYLKGHHECPPYSGDSKKTVYHVRNIDVFRLKQIKSEVDICLSHDWPRGVHQYGNAGELLRRKPFFRQDIEENKLGSRPAEELLFKLQPNYWFAAHLHVKFAAIIPHKKESGKVKKITKFLSLDKCLPRRKFLQIVDIDRQDDSSSSPVLRYDPEWLCILKSTNHLQSAKNHSLFMPGPGCSERYNFEPTDDEMKEMDELFARDYGIPNNFVKTAPCYKRDTVRPEVRPAQPQINPQTTEFCRKLNVIDPMTLIMSANGISSDVTSPEEHDWSYVDVSESDVTQANPDEISCLLDDEDVGCRLDYSQTKSLDESQSSCDERKRLPETEIDPGSSAEPKMAKTFKRRNQAIYAERDSSD
ncbi:DBR1 (predicted) [Pycnogonum litorale]